MCIDDFLHHLGQQRYVLIKFKRRTNELAKSKIHAEGKLNSLNVEPVIESSVLVVVVGAMI